MPLFALFVVLFIVILLGEAVGLSAGWSLAVFGLLFAAGLVALINWINQKAERSADAVRTKGGEIVDEHLAALLRRRRQLVKVDGYGLEDDTAWQKEREHFFVSVVLPAALPDNSGGENLLAYFVSEVLEPKIQAALTSHAHSQSNQFTMEIEPVDYEHLCAERLRVAGWNARVTQVTGDQGADIVATKGNDVMVVQCKRYANPVGNKAIQEIVGAMRYYDASYALVIATNGYTKAAQSLAAANDVMLGHHDDLVAGWVPY